MNPKRLKTLIGLELGAHRLTAVELRRAGGGRLEVRRTVQAPTGLDPLTAPPELAAREVRNLLTEAGLRPGRCIVCLPLARMLTHHVELPAIAEEDIPGFLTLEAERAFPFAPGDLSISVSRYTDPAGTRRATLAAISLNHIRALESMLRLAGMRLMSVTLGTPALAEAGTEGVEAAFAVTDAGVELIVAAGGGIAALRVLTEPAGVNDRDDTLDGPALVRECRVTLGRLPRATREVLRHARVYGPGAARRALIRVLEPELEVMGLELEPAEVNTEARRIPANGGTLPAGLTLAAARWMLGGRPAFEFLPPFEGRVRAAARRLLARGILWKLAGVGAALTIGVALAFAWQSWTLRGLEQRWQTMEPRVTELNDIQTRIRTYRPWFDDQIRTLQILSHLTEAFPATGETWSRSIQIKDQTEVTCTGLARSNADYLRLYEALQKTPGVENLESGPIRGDKPPVQFSLTYHWNTGVSDAE